MRLASVMIRLLLLGTSGAWPRYLASGSLYQRKLSGWPTKPPTVRCLRAQAPLHGPWLSVKKPSASAWTPPPPGERTPLVVGTILPSGVTLTAQPRNLLLLLNEPVRHSVTQMLPSLSKRDPKAYSW